MARKQLILALGVIAAASPALAARVTGARIDREERKGKGASDHAPVIVEIGPGPEGPAGGAE